MNSRDDLKRRMEERESRMAPEEREAEKKRNEESGRRVIEAFNSAREQMAKMEAEYERDMEQAAKMQAMEEEWLRLAIRSMAEPKNGEVTRQTIAELPEDPALRNLLDSESLRIYEIARNKSISVEERLKQISEIDNRYWYKDSEELAKLLGCTPQAIRKTKWWKVGREEKLLIRKEAIENRQEEWS